MSDTAEQDAFRSEVQTWVKENFPTSLAAKTFGMEGADKIDGRELEKWRQALADKGYGAPTWPKEYGGAGLSHPQAKFVSQEIAKAGGFNPIPMMAGMGVTMVGPTVLGIWHRRSKGPPPTRHCQRQGALVPRPF